MPKNPQEKKLRRLVFVWLAAPAVCPWTCQDKRHTAIKKKKTRGTNGNCFITPTTSDHITRGVNYSVSD